MFYSKTKLNFKITAICCYFLILCASQNSFAQVATSEPLDDTVKGIYTNFSRAIKNPTNVKILEIKKQDVDDFLNSPNSFINLEEVTLSFDKDGKYENLSQVPSLKKVTIFNCGVTFFYSNLSKLPKVETFKCKSSRLSQFPIFMLSWKNIHYINFENNYVSYIEDKIPVSTSLKTLSLKNNNLKKLPNSFSNLTSLEFLNIGLNHFTKFPTQILSLTNLKVLNIAFNPIDSIPTEISQLKNLETLYLTETKITSLPVSMKKMKKLHKVYITDLQFTEEQKQAIIKALPKKCIIEWTREDYYHSLEF